MKRLIMNKEIICVRGAGDLATGVIQKLARSGFRVYALEIGRPTTIRRQVALSTVMFTGETRVEDLIGRKLIFSREGVADCWQQGIVPVIEDRKGETIPAMRPDAVVDAILAKRNLGTRRTMAPVTIALGPGFTAAADVDVVIETMRGHRLGRMITAGAALPNTGVPGEIGGQSAQRVIHAPAAGRVRHYAQIGDFLAAGQPLLEVGGIVVGAPFDGMLRGLIYEGMSVPQGMKVADIDPRKLTQEEIFGISDKARNLGGAVLEAYLYCKINMEQEKV